MEHWQVVDSVNQYESRALVDANLKKAGLPLPPKPQNAENLYQEWEMIKGKHGGVANIPFRELGDFLDKWTGLVSYARWVEAIADIDMQTAREIRDTIKKQLFTLQPGGREQKDALVQTDPLYIKYEVTFTKNLAMYTATKALREGYEYRTNSISREITRRGNDISDTRRSNNRGSTV